MTPIRKVKLEEIDAEALPRDRSARDPGAFAELRDSIRDHGLRLPVELCAHRGPAPYALISGHRRLAAMRELAATMPDPTPWETIPALLRDPADLPEALRLMVEENAVREAVTPWDQGRVIVESVARGLFDTPDAAVAALHPKANRFKRMRIRSLAQAVEAYGDGLVSPETLSQQKLSRLAAAAREGWAELICKALTDSSAETPAAQWSLIERILAEAEAQARGTLPPDIRPGKPCRRLRLRPRLVIRREMARDGWTLRFTGPDATGELVEEVMAAVEREFGQFEQ